MTYRKLLEALKEAQKRKAREERCADDLFQCPPYARATAEARLRKAQAYFDMEIE